MPLKAHNGRVVRSFLAVVDVHIATLIGNSKILFKSLKSQKLLQAVKYQDFLKLPFVDKIELRMHKHHIHLRGRKRHFCEW